MAELEKSGSNLLHLQVSDYIREKIYSQEWGVRDKIPSEHELMKLLGVSRGTVQKGISTLVNEGLLVKVRGKGTYVAEPVLKYATTNGLLSFAESLRMQGVDFVTKVLDQEVEPANDTVASMLKIPVGSPVLNLRRLRSTNDEPILLMESKVNLVACPELEKTDFTTETLFSTVERCSGRHISYAKVKYGARIAGKERGDLLQCDESAPTLNIDQLVVLDDEQVSEWANMWLPANKYVLTSLLQRW